MTSEAKAARENLQPESDPGENPSPVIVHPPVVSDADFKRLKEELLAEMPVRWKTWFFHPAWTAAAAALLIASVLLPSSSRRGGNRPGAIENFPSQPARPPARRDRLPPSRPTASPTDPDFPRPAPALLAEAAAALADARGKTPETFSQFPGASPPQLIDRPPPIDDEKLSWDLAVLAGLQIGGKEWDDAEQAIAMLSRRHPEKAEALAKMLAAGRAAAAREAPIGVKPSEPEPPLAAESGPSEPPSATTAASPSREPPAAPTIEAGQPAAPSGSAATEAAANPPAPEPPVPQPLESSQTLKTPEPAVLGESSGAGKSAEAAMPVESTSPAEMDAPLALAETALPILPDDVAEESEANDRAALPPTPAPPENGIASMTDSFSQPSESSHPPFEGFAESPPLSWELLSNQPANPPRRRPFTTDPYLRDD